MKTKSIETEEQQRVRAALKKLQNATDEAASYQQLHEAAKAEVAAFAATGDLSDLNAVAAIVPRQVQAALSEQRIAIAAEKIVAAEREIADEAKTLQSSILNALSRVRCGLVERAARSMKEHFENLQAARRQAFSSTAVRESDGRIHGLENLSMNLEPPQMAQELLKNAPEIFGEVENLEQELGGIPSETELRAP
jgi:hypothetical protein